MEKYTKRSIKPFILQFEFLQNAHVKLADYRAYIKNHEKSPIKENRVICYRMGLKIRKLKVAIAQAQRGLESMRGKEVKPPYIRIIKLEQGLEYLQKI